MKINDEKQKSWKERILPFETKGAYLVFGLVFIVLTAIMFGVKYYGKIQFYSHSLVTWLWVAGYLGLTTAIISIIAHIDNTNFCRISKNYIIKGMKIVLIVILVGTAIGYLISSPMMKSKNYYSKVSKDVKVITDEVKSENPDYTVEQTQTPDDYILTEEANDGSSAFPELIGKDGDTSNLPLIGVPEAIKNAETQMGKFPALGSQFELRKEDITSQNIKGSLCYVIPLQPKNLFKWDKEGNRGYFIIDRNNGDTQFIEKSLKTTTAAPFKAATKRVVNKYLSQEGIQGLVTDISPEVDDQGNFHYIATVYNIDGIDGFKSVIGVVDVNAETKECSFYKLGEIPEYIDRVFPEEFFNDYISYYGSYKNGFINSLISQKGVLEATKGSDVVYINGVCYYYTGYTSAGKDNSSNGIMMMNSRTGKINYHVTYGISESKAKGVAEGLVQEKQYKASYPLLLKVGGKETYFMLMRDSKENITGYCFVNYKEYTIAAYGKNLLEAQAEYIKSLSKENRSNSLDETSISKITGNISSITSEVIEGTTLYYIKVEGHDTIFQMFSDVNIDVVFSKPGDPIKIEYYNSESKLETITKATF